jgi:predicted ATPase
MSRVTIRELRLINYRAFSNARLVLDDVTFLVGRNAAGKSTLMDAFSFIREAVTDSVGTALERRGNYMGLVNRRYLRDARSSIAVAVCLQHQSEAPMLYGFEIIPGSKGSGYEIQYEALQGHETPSFFRYGHFFDSNVTSLYPRTHEETLLLPLIAGSNDTWKTVHDALRLISVHQLSPQALRSEPIIGGRERLSHDGHNAGDVLKYLRPADRAWIVEHLAGAVPGISGIRAAARAGRRIIRFAQDVGAGRTEQFDASAMSDGTLRSLGILLALKQSPRPSIVLLDEIEDSLHPYAHGVILDAIEAASEEFPIVVSTHSPEILSHPTAQANRIRVIQWQEGRSSIYRLGEGVRENLEPPLTVGQLLRANALWTDDEPLTIGDGDDFFKP